MIRPAPILFTALALAVLVPPVGAQQGRQQREERQTQERGFSGAERDAIVAYFRAHPQDVQPLPPGIVRRLERGKPLPPGIARTRLPASLTEQLPQREGFEITIFGDRIVLLEASGLVVDVLEGIFRL